MSSSNLFKSAQDSVDESSLEKFVEFLDQIESEIKDDSNDKQTNNERKDHSQFSVNDTNLVLHEQSQIESKLNEILELRSILRVSNSI